MLRPLVTVAIPAYNAETTVGRAIRSVVAQCVLGTELIVVDDGSTDNTLELATTYADENPGLVVLSQPNGGTSSALNLAFSRAEGEFLLAVGADDELLPGFLADALQQAERFPDYDIYSCDLLLTFPDGEERRFYEWDQQRSVTLDDMLQGVVIPGGGTLFRKDVFESINGYRTDVRRVEDEDFWMRALLAGFRHVYYPSCLYRYVQGEPGQKSGSPMAEHSAKMEILEDLIGTGRLTTAQVDLARAGVAHSAAIVAKEAERPLYGGQTREEYFEARMSEQAEAMRESLSRLFSPVLARSIVRVLESIAWLVRPARRASANLSARKAKRRR